MRIVCISDTHGMWYHQELPTGDVLVHAGDITAHGAIPEVESFDAWLWEQHHLGKFREAVVVAGNHDQCFEQLPQRTRSALTFPHYLEGDSIVIDGLKFWGGPWQPRFFNWSFNVDRGHLHPYWARIPEDTDVLITHGPPYGILDISYFRAPHRVGCRELSERLEVVHPRLHVFGHIHGQYGVVSEGGQEGTIYVNASICTEGYRPTNPPIVVDL